MRLHTFKSALIKGLAASIVLLASEAALAQQTVNLAAAPTIATLPDGSAVPMWGYNCGALVTGSTATCAKLNPAAATNTAWSPVVITVPTGQALTINLTNNLSFTPTGATTPNNIPTSLTIVGQLGGGLGTPGASCNDPVNGVNHGANCVPSPAHAPLGVSWATPNSPGGTNPTFNPPPQPPRVQSFATEVAAGATTSLTWPSLRPGTYLIESGTHPSIQGPMGLYGILVVTTAPASTASGTAYGVAGTATAVNYGAEVSMLFSEIDPVQNAAVQAAVNNANFSETRVWSGQPIGPDSNPGCGNPNSGAYFQSCYPPVVNYTPFYYLINGVAFDRTNATGSLFPALTGTSTAPATGNLLVRLVNAGLRMHVPSIVGSTAPCTPVAPATTCPGGFALVAEDGNVLPGLPRVQSEVFMAAGKTYDVMVNVPATPTGAAAPPALPIYDRELSLSGNAVNRDAGMLAYIGVNGAVAPSAAVLQAVVANDDTYNALVAGQTLTVSDPAKGVIANDTNVYGVTLLAPATSGTVALARNGTFTYTPNTGSTAKTDFFTYCANGSVTLGVCSSGHSATVSLAPSNVFDSGITCVPSTFTATTAIYLAVKTPGLLAGCTDGAGLPLKVVPTSVAATGLTVVADANGGFTASVLGASTFTYTLNYQVQNSQGMIGTGTATVAFPTASNLVVNVLDGGDKKTPITDYRWVIEEDRTFYIDPTTVTNNGGTSIVPTLGVNFHTSNMPFVAQGCTGPLSCAYGQTVLDTGAACTSPGVPAGCSPTAGQHVPAVCDVGNGMCRPDPNALNGTTAGGFAWVQPGQVHLDPTKRYYLSVLPGDSAAPFQKGYAGSPDCSAAGMAAGKCGHGMGGAPIGIDPNTKIQQSTVTVYAQPSPFPPAQLSVFVFEDDFPLNGEHDGGGGVDVIGPNEPGLGGFQIHLWDAMGGNGDFTGQMSYDMFNQPLSNSLAGTKDPITGFDACPITPNPLVGGSGTTDPTATGITGMIVTCPKFESDGKTLSPLAGQAVIKNLMPGRFGIVATPAADRIARGEEWLQTNTLDGQKAHDSFARIGEPSYFQEFGPASYHVSIGFANPQIINARKQFLCNGTDPNAPTPGAKPSCNNTLSGTVTGQRLSRTPDERLYNSGTHDAFYWTQCYVSVGDPDGEDFAFTKCKADGSFTLTGLPDGDWRITTFDQWNDQLVDGLSTPVRLGGVSCSTPNAPPTSCNPSPTPNAINMQIAATQWQTNLYTKTFIDDNKDGLAQSTETGIPFANVAVRLRDGSLENLSVTDFTGTANFNETFPLFSWYTVETDVTRYKNTGTHVVYDVGGPADGTTACGQPGYPPCGGSTIGKNLANTAEQVSVPTNLRVPGAIYCAGADCSGKSMNPTATGGGTTNASDQPSTCTTTAGVTTCSPQLSSGRIDPPWVGGEGWQGFPGQNSFLEFGKTPYQAGENGGIKGHVVYASTRPFDDPQMLVQTQWEPLVPHVTINLYQEGFASDGVTPTRTLVDTTYTTSFDDWAQGFRRDINGIVLTNPADGTGVPNMSCPGQGATTGPLADLFFFSLYNQPLYLDQYIQQHAKADALNVAATGTPLPYNSQFKCYDGMHNWNQLQPAPYDGQYKFPSVVAKAGGSGQLPTGQPGTDWFLQLDPTTYKTNCTICSANPVDNTPMLPPGKYVVEVVVPPGMELVKEEDKNILIGDNYIAPVTQQFGGLGNVFVLPDQASVAGTFSAGAGYNASNAQNPTQNFGASPNNQIVPGFVPEPVWPCVGEARVVPDYISLYPQTQQVAPFAGATRNLCDRKEVTLVDQMHAIAKFYVYTSTHIASKFTGGITDDYTSEFDPFSPQFGEKFAPPDLPVSVKDWTGTETNRVYADHWGAYNGMTYSTWEVNPPNPTGYSPQMNVLCMNDPGPITDTRPTVTVNGVTGPNPTLGQLVTDPLFTQGYSQFCYELPFMPGTTQYLDTPVVPTAAFAGAGYNNADCAEPDATPAISEVDGDGVGPWVSAPGKTLTITALGDQMVPNHAYSGPSATTPPYNQKTVNRHYGFGSAQGSGSVTIGGVAATVTAWSDTSITVTVPTGVANCAVQQQAAYGGSAAQCGQLVIKAANGKQSIDSVTVTVGGKAPTHVAASGSIQAAIDAAAPGDLIIVDPTCQTTTAGVTSQVACTTAGAIKTIAAHNELLVMWKPLRLQGVGASSSIINANTHPAGKLTSWRLQVGCLFGLGPDGTPNTFLASCGAGWNGFNPTTFNPQVDRIAFEGIMGWNASANGNLAQLLQEPSLMGALEGAGITVVGKGVYFSSNSFDPALALGFPTGTVLFTAANTTTPVVAGGPAPCDGTFPSNFLCNPSSIDGLGITNSSQGGGGVFVHAWAHSLQIANNRIYNNAGTLSGGVNVGLGEFAPNTIAGATTNLPPGSCESGGVAGSQLPYCIDTNVNMHHNYISLNNSTGDELFSATPAGAGGVSICTGSDYYKFNYNWVCGNLSNGDGGGLGHLGFSKNGDIEHNWILFNQSTNPTIPTNGGGMTVMGTPDADPTCGTTTDQDCVSPLGQLPPSDGVGPGLVINANLIMGNAAESGSGGGISFQNVNGTEVVAFPTTPAQWYDVTVTNNIIANNVAGWDGGGLSLLDALNVNILNNTIASNVTTASAGVLNNTLGAPLASTQNCPNGATNAQGFCTVQVTSSTPQPAGLVAINNSAILQANLPATVTCPPGHYAGATAANGTCRSFSYPVLANNVFWQNEAYYIAVGALSAQYQQNVVTLYNGFTTTPAPSQATTGQCLPASYWDIGMRGDAAPGSILAPTYSVLTNSSENGLGSNNLLGANPQLVSQYCNGSRQPPEACNGVTGCGWAVPPGISDATVPNPIFNLTPVATVDEGNNWINIRWGPLSLTNPAIQGTDLNYGGGAPLGNYALNVGSPAIDHIPVTPATFPTTMPTLRTDFFGNPRPDVAGSQIDVGAVELQTTGSASAYLIVRPTALAFGSSRAAQTLTLSNTGTATATGIAVSLTAPFSRPAGGAGGTCTTTLAAGATCTINVIFRPTATGLATGSGTITASVPVVGSPVELTGDGVLGATLAPAAWSAIARRGVGLLGAPTQFFTLTNTGNAPLTGILQGVLGGTNAADWTIIRFLSTCGPAGGGQLAGQTTLAVGAACVVTAQFRPLTGEPLNSLSATLSVTDAAGTQTSTLTGTATGAGLASISPASGLRGTTVPVTLTGTNLTAATAVNVAGTGVACSITGTTTATTLTASCAIAASAARGPRSVTVSTPTGPSNAVTFTVTGATVAFAGPAPSLLNGASTSHTGTVTVSNTATGAIAAPFTFSAAPALSKVGTAGGSFSITGGTCGSASVLNPGGGSCTIVVQYVPGGTPVTTTATAYLTVTGVGLAAPAQTSANFTAN